MAVHFLFCLLVLGLIAQCFLPAVREALAGRTAWSWALGAVLPGRYVLLSWLFVVVRRHRRAAGGAR
jgi:hypothetical protein